MKLKLNLNGVAPSPTPEPDGSYKNNRKKWKQIKADWLAQNLDPTIEKPFTLKDVALKWGIPYETVKAQSSAHKWSAELKACQEEIDAHAAEAFIEGLSVTEADIRLRQHKFTSALLEKSYAALQSIDPTTISAKDATNMARLALTQERAAVGLAERIDFQDLSKPTHDDHESPLAKMQEAKRKNALADKLLKMMDDGDEPQDQTG